MPKKRNSAEGPQEQYRLFQLAEVPNAFRKPVQVIHSKPQAPMSLLQRKISNAWLKNAVDHPPDSDGWWTIGVASMLTQIDFNSNNRAYLRESALELMKIVYEWDALGKKGHFKASVLFPEIEIMADRVRYQISHQLRELVLNPEIYALIDLNVISKFRRSSTVALYEHCVRFARIGKTTAVPWQLLRDILLGEHAGSKIYDEYKRFSEKILRPSIAELNAESDIRVEAITTKIGRSIDTIQFEVKRKVDETPIDVEDLEAMEMIGELVRLGVLQSEARKLVKQYGVDRTRAAHAYTLERMQDRKAAKLEKPAAYFRMALEKGFASDPADNGRESIDKKKQAKPQGPDLASLYLLEQDAKAESYFAELDLQDQDALVSRYNDHQPTSALQVKKNGKHSRAAKTAFFRWLGLDTWGQPTTEDLLAFAQSMLGQKAAR